MRLSFVSLILTFFIVSSSPCVAQIIPDQSLLSIKYSIPDSINGNLSSYKGWDHLVDRLAHAGVPQEELSEIYLHPLMPKFSPIYFSLNPKESHNIYRGFASKTYARRGATFLNDYAKVLRQAQTRYDVDPKVITAIMLIESHFGDSTGNQFVIQRLSRLAGLSDPANVWNNYRKLSREQRGVTYDKVNARAKYLEKTFLPEIPALVEIARRQNASVFDFRGSSAGAFGIPQFLPSSYLRFGVDGNKDRFVSLYSISDSIMSVANFLSSFGWKNSLSEKEKRKVVWHYNHSDAYITAVLRLAGMM